MSSLESISQLQLPADIEARLCELTKRNAVHLTAAEKEELEFLVETRELLSTLRTKAKRLTSAQETATHTIGRSERTGLPVVLVPAATPLIDPVAVRRSLQEEGF
jgi:hypothetical protein